MVPFFGLSCLYVDVNIFLGLTEFQENKINSDLTKSKVPLILISLDKTSLDDAPIPGCQKYETRS